MTERSKQKLEDFIKMGKILPASELAKAKEEEAARAVQFAAAVEQEQSLQKTHRAPVRKPREITSQITREIFKD